MASTPDHATSFVKPSFKRFSITAGGPFGTHFHQAIHESMTLTALISSNIASSPTTTLANASNQDWEYIRGVIWNDDPDCFLFANSAETNHDYSTVGTVQWGAAFALGAAQWQVFNVARLKNITGRSHYGDLQFLHCMATQAGEAATETKRKIMLWLEVMYKLANAEDGITGDTKIGDTALREFFPAEASPNSDQTLGYLLSKNGSGAFEKTDVRRRALGSMFHVIQDLYALGHTRRTLLNPQDKISDSKCRRLHRIASEPPYSQLPACNPHGAGVNTNILNSTPGLQEGGPRPLGRN
jgi:hypothetical protein